MDLLAFVQDIDNREWIEYKNIEKLTIVFLYYLELITTATPEEEVQVCSDLKKIAKVYSKTPKQFIVKIQEKYRILQKLNMENKWISVIHEIFSKSQPVKSIDFQISIKEKIIQEYQYEDEYDDSYDYQDSFLNVESIQEPDQIEENTTKENTTKENTQKEVVKTSKKNHNRKNGHYRKLQKGMGGNF